MHSRRLHNQVSKWFGAFVITLLAANSFVWAGQNPGRRLTGTVADRSGAAVPRVTIELRTSSGALAASTLTDIQGKFTVSLPDGRYALDATAAGLAPIHRQQLEVGPDTLPIHLTLEIQTIEQWIVVTATRTEAPAAQVGSSTTVIRGEDLAAAGIDTMAEALRSAAGLTVAQNGSTGQLVSLFIRGGESDYTKVLIDGIPVNDPGGSFNFANMSIAGIDRIEIVRGPQSALFGSEATAGVIQVFTRRGTSEGLTPKPQVAAEAGSYHTFRYEAGIGGKSPRFDYAASFARMDTDNNVRNGSFNDVTSNVNIGVRPSSNSRLRAVFRTSAGRAGIPGQWALHEPDSDQYYRHRALAGGINFSHSPSSTWTQELSYSLHDSRQYSEDSVDTGGFVAAYQGRTSPYRSYDFAFRTLNESRRQTLAYRSEFSLPHAHLLTAGAEYERESGTVGDPSTDPLDAVRNNVGLFVQDQWFFHKRFFATAGLRLEHNASFGRYAAPRLSLAWQVRQPDAGSFLGLAKIKTNFGMGIKEPTLVESFSKSPFFLGNPNLRPEKSRSFDIGFEQQIREGAWEIIYFENRFRDQIDFLTTDFTTFSGTFFNTGKSRARGIEVDLAQKLPRGFEISSMYTFTASVILENPAAFDPVLAPGQGLLRRPRHAGRLDVKWRPLAWVFGATATFVGSRVDSDFLGLGFDRNPGYYALDLVAGRRIPGGMFVYVAVNNALNRGYMEVFGYPALPARFRIGINAGF